MSSEIVAAEMPGSSRQLLVTKEETLTVETHSDTSKSDVPSTPTRIVVSPADVDSASVKSAQSQDRLATPPQPRKKRNSFTFAGMRERFSHEHTTDEDKPKGRTMLSGVDDESKRAKRRSFIGELFHDKSQRPPHERQTSESSSLSGSVAGSLDDDDKHKRPGFGLFLSGSSHKSSEVDNTSLNSPTSEGGLKRNKSGLHLPKVFGMHKHDKNGSESDRDLSSVEDEKKHNRRSLHLSDVLLPHRHDHEVAYVKEKNADADSDNSKKKPQFHKRSASEKLFGGHSDDSEQEKISSADEDMKKKRHTIHITSATPIEGMSENELEGGASPHAPISDALHGSASERENDESSSLDEEARKKHHRHSFHFGDVMHHSHSEDDDSAQKKEKFRHRAMFDNLFHGGDDKRKKKDKVPSRVSDSAISSLVSLRPKSAFLIQPVKRSSARSFTGQLVTQSAGG